MPRMLAIGDKQTRVWRSDNTVGIIFGVVNTSWQILLNKTQSKQWVSLGEFALKKDKPTLSANKGMQLIPILSN